MKIINTLQELARIVATFAHSSQTYGDGKPYDSHLAAVVGTMLEFGITDDKKLAAGWLHDILEDTPISVSQITETFGADVAKLVFAVTNERGVNRAERNIKTYYKMLDYPEAIEIKLCDRIANVRNALENAATTRFYNMYQKEYILFRETLYKEGEYVALWLTLDSLLEYTGV